MRQQTFANRTQSAVTTWLNATEELLNANTEYSKADMATAMTQQILNDTFGTRTEGEGEDSVTTPNVTLAEFNAVFYAIAQLQPNLTGEHIPTLLKLKR